MTPSPSPPRPHDSPLQRADISPSPLRLQCTMDSPFHPLETARRLPVNCDLVSASTINLFPSSSPLMPPQASQSSNPSLPMSLVQCRHCPSHHYPRRWSRPLPPAPRTVFHPQRPSHRYGPNVSKDGRFTPLRFVPLSVLVLITLLCTCSLGAVEEERRDKNTDENYQPLIPYKDIPLSCDSGSESGFGIVEGGLEKCDVHAKEGEAAEDDQEASDYQRFKCANLRVHGQLTRSGQCECKKNWKGPICNEYVGCPEGYGLFNGVCTPNVCQHGGQLAIGSKQIECICNAPWDGRYCERLACWRMAPKEHERRWRNADDHCKCADGFEGDECDVIVSCKNGELVSGRCRCAEGWKGEICERKCIPNQTCSASGLYHHRPLLAGFISTLLLGVGCCLLWPLRL